MVSPDNKKLDWIEVSSMASALGDEMVTLDEQKISEIKTNGSLLIQPDTWRIITEEKAQTMIQHLSFQLCGVQLDFDSKGSANTTMKRIKSSSSKYRRATLKVLRGDQLHEDISEAKVSICRQKAISI